jgi:hypothetical protein
MPPVDLIEEAVGDGKWHVEKKIPLTLIVILLAQGLAGWGVVVDLRKDIELIKAQLVVQRDRDERQDAISRERVLEVRDALIDLRRVIEKLADKLEKRS